MQCVKKSVLVPYSARRCSTWSTASRTIRSSCRGAPAHACWRRTPAARPRASTSTTTACARISRPGNDNTPPTRSWSTLKDGPFRTLHGEWRFRALRADACKVEFDLTYEFSTGLLDRVIGPVFNHIAHHLHRRVRQARRGRLRAAGLMRVAVACAPPGREAIVEVDLADGRDGGRRGRRDRPSWRGSASTPPRSRSRSTGSAARPDTPLAEGDRVEILLPLRVDPKAARRLRARRKAADRARSRRTGPGNGG